MSTALVSCFTEFGELFPKIAMSPGKSSYSRSNNCGQEKKTTTFGQLPQLSVGFGQQQIGGGGALRRCASTSSPPPPSPPSPTFSSNYDIISTNGSTTTGIHNNNNNNNMLNCGNGNNHRKLDRSMSEPVERAPPHGGRAQLAQLQQQQQQQQQSNSSRYKTELCRPFEESGTCKYGDKCQFAHGHHELRTLARHPKYKTELCRTFHTIGFCPYGPRCHFIHNKNEARKSSPSPPPLTTGSCSSSSSTSSSNDNSSSTVNRHNQPSRPKALSIGNFSLGSVGDSPSPTSLSSLGDSPTGPLRFVEEDNPFSPFNYPSNPATPVICSMELARSVFSFGGSQELGTCPTPPLPIGMTSGSMVLRSCSSSTSSLSSSSSHDGGPRRSSSIGGQHKRKEQFVRSQYHDADTFGGLSPPSPAGSLASDLDSLSLSGSSPPTCASPLEVSRGLPNFFFGFGDD